MSRADVPNQGSDGGRGRVLANVGYQSCIAGSLSGHYLMNRRLRPPQRRSTFPSGAPRFVFGTLERRRGAMTRTEH